MSRHGRDADDHRVLALDHVDLTRTMDSAHRIVLHGTLDIPRDAGRIKAFDVKVIYPGDDPTQLPDVYDPVGRFPPRPQRHIEADGRFCLWLRELAPYHPFSRPGGLALLLTRVQEFLELQMQYETRVALGIANPWPGNDWDHGDAARHEWLAHELAARGHQRLTRLVRAADRPLKRHARCPCGSGRRARDCHQRMISGMREAWGRDPSGREAAHQFLEKQRDVR